MRKTSALSYWRKPSKFALFEQDGKRRAESHLNRVTAGWVPAVCRQSARDFHLQHGMANMTQKTLSRIGWRSVSVARLRPHAFSLKRTNSVALGLLLGALISQSVQAGPPASQGDVAQRFTPAACYDLVRSAGRMIAWARWEGTVAAGEARPSSFRAGTPAWAIQLVHGWIDDAYQWRESDDQIREWAAELGSVEDLPRADELSRHETIAIWMRRIGRQCTD